MQCRTSPNWSIQFSGVTYWILYLQGSKIILQIFPSFIILFPDHSFYEKLQLQLQTGVSFICAESQFCSQGAKCSSIHFLLLSIYSQNTHSMRKSIFVKSGVTDKNPLCECGIQNSPLDISFFHHFVSRPLNSYYVKIKFLCCWSCRQGPPLSEAYCEMLL